MKIDDFALLIVNKSKGEEKKWSVILLFLAEFLWHELQPINLFLFDLCVLITGEENVVDGFSGIVLPFLSLAD